MKTSRSEYLERINRALDYIDQNLSRELTLREIAEHAWFSPYHFHRIFSAVMGETLAAFIRRIRLEKAAGMLLANPGRSVTDIALDCGFSSSSVFARSFKSRFNMNAGQWRDAAIRKNCKTESNGCQDVPILSKYDYRIDGNRVIIPTIRRTEEMKFEALKVEVREMEALNVAYVRHVGPYAGDGELFAGLFGTLMRWAGPRGLLGQPDQKTVIVYHDNPDVTDQSKLRTSVCISVPDGTPVEGEIGQMVIPEGKYACGYFELSTDEYESAWNAMCGEWLPDSGWQPDDRPCFELCLNCPDEHPDGKHQVEICIPVKPL